jgi:hypothetical protein
MHRHSGWQEWVRGRARSNLRGGHSSMGGAERGEAEGSRPLTSWGAPGGVEELEGSPNGTRKARCLSTPFLSASTGAATQLDAQAISLVSRKSDNGSEARPRISSVALVVAPRRNGGVLGHRDASAHVPKGV